MKKITFLFLLATSTIFAQRTCLTHQKMDEVLNTAEKKAHHDDVMSFIRNASQENLFRINSENGTQSTNVVVTIPVVFHVLYKNASQNISDAQILSQLDVLNKDYRKLNTDFSSVVPPAFQGISADMEIVFCKATKTPAGAATTGIIRKSIPQNAAFGTIYYQNAGDPAWNPSKYLNIWIGILDGDDDGILGWAFLPDQAGQAWDGFVCDYRYFGTTGTATAPYNKGRTCTHEIGHYLGLDHPWGDDNSLCGTTANSDGVSDTPATDFPYYGCPTFPSNANACTATTNGSLFMNYMDYVDDSCMGMFTNGQKTIVQNTMSGPRSSILTSATTACGALSVEEFQAIKAITVYPNPASVEFFIASPFKTIDEVEIYNQNGQLVKVTKIDEASSNKVNVDGLASGIYFLRIYDKNEFVKSDKLIIK
jgi:hypothetical protein